MIKVSIFNNQFLIKSPNQSSKAKLMIKFFMRQGDKFGTDFIKKILSFFLISLLIKRSIKINLNENFLRTINLVLDNYFGKKYNLIGLNFLTFGGYIALIKAKEKYFLLRIKDIANKKIDNERKGILIFSQIDKIEVPKIVYYEQFDGFDISLETALLVPYFRDFFKLTNKNFLNIWKGFINQKSYSGLVSKSEGIQKINKFIKSKLLGSPEWFSIWYMNLDWDYLDYIIGKNPIGPIHGDINNNNCWYRNNTLFLIDFERTENNSPMFVDLIKWELGGDLNVQNYIFSKRVRKVLRKGIKGFDSFSNGLENFNRKKEMRAAILLITLLFEFYWGLKNNFSFKNERMEEIIKNIKYIKNFLKI